MDSNTDWRQDWEIDEKTGQVALPTAWHRSGLCFEIEYDDILWVFWTSEVSKSRQKELRLEMGDSAYAEIEVTLLRQLRQVWQDLGYTDFSPRKIDFSAPWREEWVMDADEHASFQAQHASGLRLTIHPDIDMGCVPVWEASESKHFADECARLKREMGDQPYAEFLSKRRRQALELWYGLGYGNGGSLRSNPYSESAPSTAVESPSTYALWFEFSPFSEETEPAAREAARVVLDRHFGPRNVAAAHEAALATGKRYTCESGAVPEAVRVWLSAISEAYWAAWSSAGLPPLTAELSRDNPQLDDSCVMIGPVGSPEAEQKPFGLTRRLFDVWVESSAFNPDDEACIADDARDALWQRFGSQEAVLEANAACQAAGGIHAPDPQPVAVVEWRNAAREALAEAIENLTRFDEEAAARIRAHPNFARCFVEVGSPRPSSSV